MAREFSTPLTKVYPMFGPGQWGVQGADRPLGLRLDTRANVFYVDSGHPRTSDNNDGTDPDNPLTTITTANLRATANANDFIWVRQINNALETFPITITKHRLHLLSVFYDFGKGPEIRPPGATAGILLNADNVEIAGFEINGGNASGCIEASQVAATWGADIHHNRFAFQATTPQDGIRMAGAVDKPHWMIHENWFNSPITRDGIRIEQNSTRSEIWGNHFRLTNAANTGINLATLCTDIYAIHDNRFAVADAGVGEAIDCNINSANCMFWGNVAGQGMAAMGNIPYQDLSAGANDWGINYAGILAVFPV